MTALVIAADADRRVGAAMIGDQIGDRTQRHAREMPPILPARCALQIRQVPGTARRDPHDI
jgi:hypothetical protein